MASFYPRKQTVIIFVVCLVVVIGTAYFVSPQDLPSTSAQQIAVSGLQTAESVKSSETLAIDASAFPDWQEQFANSDQNGASKSTATEEENLTDTDRFGRDFFSRYVALKQANLLSNEEIVNQATSDLVTSGLNSVPQKIYASSDIRIISSTDAVSLNAYSSAVANVMDSYSITKNESTIVNEYLATQDAKVLKGLDIIIATYTRMITSFIAIPTPQIISKEHLQLLNAFETLKFSAQALRTLESDTVKGLSGISAHVNGASQVIQALTNTYNTLKKNGTIFEFNQEILNVLLG